LQVTPRQTGMSDRQQDCIFGRKVTPHMACKPGQQLAFPKRKIRSGIETPGKSRPQPRQKPCRRVKISADTGNRAPNSTRAAGDERYFVFQ